MMLIVSTGRKPKCTRHHEASIAKLKFAKFYMKLGASLLITVLIFISLTRISTNVFALRTTNETSTLERPINPAVNITSHLPKSHNVSLDDDGGSVSTSSSYVPPITLDTSHSVSQHASLLPVDLNQNSLHDKEDGDLSVASATLETFQTNAGSPFYSQPAHLLSYPAHLMDQPEARQVTTLPREPPSLAELTAAATAAGILVGDLIGQQSRLTDHLQQQQQLDESVIPEASGSGRANNGSQDDEEEHEGDPGIENVINQDSGYGLDPNQQAIDVASLGTRLADQRVQRPAIYTSDQHRSAPGQSESLHGDESESGGAGGSESPDLMYDQMPDSMEGLMKLEGENTSDTVNDDSNNPMATDGSDPTEVQRSDPGLQPQEGFGISSSSLGVPATARRSSEDDEFDDDLDDNDTKPGRTYAELDNRQIVSPMPVYNQQVPVIGPNGQLESPEIYNSLADLNTAAGHYYGKKKKVKKIIIKKKKKKKVKKVKIIKIKKKKKKLSKKKKMKHHEPDHGKYYMYAKVPKKKSWEFGFKKGNKKHWIERHEKGHKNKFKTKVKWYDKKSKGKGFHIWDYNHHDKKKKHG